MGIENFVEFSYNYNDQCYIVNTLPPMVESNFLYEPLSELSRSGNERGVPFLYCADFNKDLPKRSPFLYEVPNGSILGHSNIVINDDNQFGIEGIIYNPTNLWDKYVWTEPFSNFVGDPCNLNSNSIYFRFEHCKFYKEAVHIGFHTNYGHWLYNHLGRLAFIQHSEYLSQLPIVVPSDIGSKGLEWLSYFGYDGDRIIFTESGMLHKFEKLWLPTMPWYWGRYDPIDISGWSDKLWLSKGVVDFLRMGIGLGKEEICKGKRFLISRADAKWRFLVN